MPLKKPSEFYIKNPSTSMDEVKEGLNIAAPEKIENLSEAFNVFKTNLNHIQSISDFTNKFDSFENNVQKVELLSKNVEEIRENTIAQFATQQRTVTKEDYIIRTLSMPSKFGRVAKAYIVQDDQISPLSNEFNRIRNPLALNLYTLGYNNNKHLTNLNRATKTNLATYLEQFRMLTDAINIKNAFVINFALDFEITTVKNYNNNEIILDCISELQEYFNIDKWQINQPIIEAEVTNLITSVKGVQSLEKLTFVNKSGTSLGYSQYKYDFAGATRKGVIYPSLDPSIFEIKYPNTDIKGRVTTY